MKTGKIILLLFLMVGMAFTAKATTSNLLLYKAEEGKIYDIRQYDGPSGFVDIPTTGDVTNYLNDYFAYILWDIRNNESSNKKYTIIFPPRKYIISGTLDFDLHDFSLPSNPTISYYISAGGVKINFLGYKETPAQVNNSNVYVGSVDQVNSNPTKYELFDKSKLAFTRMSNNGNPASINYLSFSPTCMPQFIAVAPPVNNTYHMFEIRNRSIPYFNNTKYELLHTAVNVMGLEIKGYSKPKDLNNPYYNKHSTGKSAVKITNFKRTHVDNLHIHEWYGNAILVANSNNFVIQKNDVVAVDDNIIEDCWGYNQTPDQNGAFDNYGDGIALRRLKNAYVRNNYI